MAQTFFEMERVQTRKLWLFFLLVLAFYFFSVFILSGVCLVATSLLNPNLIPTIWYNLGTAFVVTFFVALVFSLFHWYYSIRKGPQKILETLEAQSPDPEDRYHQIYKNVVEEIAVAMGQPKLRPLIYNTTAINGVSISTWEGEGYLILSEGAISRLSRSQLQALIAQGIARCASGEAFLTTMACSLGGAYEAMIEKLKETRREMMEGREKAWGATRSDRGMEGALMIFFVELALVILHGIFSILNIFLSRENGLRADAAAVRLSRNPLSLAEAFYIASYSWRGIGVRGGLAPLYSLPGGSRREIEREEEEGWFESLFKTHPPTFKRVKILLEMAHESSDTLDKALKNASKSPPITQEAEQLSQEVKDQWFVQSGQNWKGPFATGDLLAQPFVNLESWVRIGNSEKPFPLYAIPTLAHHFKGKGDGGKLTCPECKIPLMVAEKTGLRIRKCSQCEGVLVTKEKTIRVLARRELAFSPGVVELSISLPSWQEAKKLKEGNPIPLRKCPSCQKEMDRGPYNMAYSVEIDRCSPCGLIWFDFRELEIIQYLMEEHRMKEMTGF